jgi:hypothetical protein
VITTLAVVAAAVAVTDSFTVQVAPAVLALLSLAFLLHIKLLSPVVLPSSTTTTEATTGTFMLSQLLQQLPKL